MSTHWIALVCLAILLGPGTAEGDGQVFDERYPQRKEQVSAAENGGVSLRFFDKGRTSATSMSGIPLELRGIVVYDERGLRPFLDGLGPYFGFVGRERVIVEDGISDGDSTIYRARQMIDGLTTDVWLRIHVSNETYRVRRVDGVLYSADTIDDEHAVSEEIAESLVRDFVRSGAYLDPAVECSDIGRENLDPDGELVTEGLYKRFGSEDELRRWWGVGVPVTNPESLSQKVDPYDWFWVDPLGTVSYWVYGWC